MSQEIVTKFYHIASTFLPQSFIFKGKLEEKSEDLLSKIENRILENASKGKIVTEWYSPRFSTDPCKHSGYYDGSFNLETEKLLLNHGFLCLKIKRTNNNGRYNQSREEWTEVYTNIVACKNMIVKDGTLVTGPEVYEMASKVHCEKKRQKLISCLYNNPRVVEDEKLYSLYYYVGVYAKDDRLDSGEAFSLLSEQIETEYPGSLVSISRDELVITVPR